MRFMDTVESAGGGRSGGQSGLLKTDEWYTPTAYVEVARSLMGSIDLDPASCDEAQAVVRAATYFTRVDDGLSLPWHGRVWLNPPYSYPGIERWIEKLIAEDDAGRVERAVMIVNASTDVR